MNLLALPSPSQTFDPKTTALTIRGGERITGMSLMALPSQLGLSGSFRRTQINGMSLMALPSPLQGFENKSTPPVGRGEPESSYGQLHGWNKRRTLQWGGKFKPE